MPTLLILIQKIAGSTAVRSCLIPRYFGRHTRMVVNDPPAIWKPLPHQGKHPSNLVFLPREMPSAEHECPIVARSG